MEIKQLEPKEKVLTFFGEFKSANVESAIKEIVKINISDQEYLKQCRQWAIDNGQDPSPAKLTPIEFYLSTYGGACYDGLALHDVIESSKTPIEVICTGKIMSMGDAWHISAGTTESAEQMAAATKHVLNLPSIRSGTANASPI